jgi:hypothetical protein
VEISSYAAVFTITHRFLTLYPLKNKGFFISVFVITQPIIMTNFYTNCVRVLLNLLIFTSFLQVAKAQTTITTPYTGSFTFFAAPANIAFVVENTNSTPVIITGVGQYCETNANNSVWELYYSATSLSGTGSPVPGASWTLIATSSPVPVAASGIVPVFNSLRSLRHLLQFR